MEDQKSMSMKTKCLLSFVGMNILAAGIILNTKSTLGVGAINTLPYTAAEILESKSGNHNCGSLLSLHRYSVSSYPEGRHKSIPAAAVFFHVRSRPEYLSARSSGIRPLFPGL